MFSNFCKHINLFIYLNFNKVKPAKIESQRAEEKFHFREIFMFKNTLSVITILYCFIRG